MKTRNTILAILGLLAVLLLWHQVFVMTGVLWWDAPEPGERLPALPPLDLRPPDTRLIDPAAYLATHPDWRPQ
jgi:hypothetical protein